MVEHRNLPVPALVEAALRRGEGILTSSGALAVTTGKYTGRSPRDRFIVEDPATSALIDWGPVNQPISRHHYERLRRRVEEALARTPETFVFEGYVGRHPAYRWPVRVVTDDAWRCLFARDLFVARDGLGPEPDGLGPEPDGFGPEDSRRDDHPYDRRRTLTVLASSAAQADPAVDGVNSEAFVVLDLTGWTVVIGGTRYAGEIKKSVFSFLNYLLPTLGVLPMHCGANVAGGGTGDPAGDGAALFFGLSGTGKTTLSADPDRRLVGDDEHGWADDGIFNFEGGCYAKCINLSREKEPQIWGAIRFGAVLENVVVDPETREADFASDRLTENTRAAYPLSFIPNAIESGRAGHPKVLLFLTADAFGVLPPLARLDHEQALRYFLLGYTSRLAGTERGVSRPEATFSSCFGAPFLPLKPRVYADLLAERLRRHGSEVYLVNTGWSGGPYGVGRRMDLAVTRALVRAAIAGRLKDVPFRPDPVFGLLVPEACPGVPREVLVPRDTWDDKEAFDRTARELAAAFKAGAGGGSPGGVPGGAGLG